MYFRAITRGEFPLRSSKQVLCFLPVMAAGVEGRRTRLDGVSHTLQKSQAMKSLRSVISSVSKAQDAQMLRHRQISSMFIHRTNIIFKFCLNC